jgi:pimeloyl-ACP methyl ester carboxylesterase
VQNHYSLLNQMACLSEAAYGQPPSPGCSQWMRGPGIRVISHAVTLLDASGRPYDGSYTLIIDDTRKQQVIAIRGTANKQDWLTDIRFVPVTDGILRVTVHHGFELYARAVLDDLIATGHISELNRTYDTYVAGHSLGGAVAVLLALYLNVQYPSVLNLKGVYTYGQPKVFDNNGATSWPGFADNIYRVENCYDPVPTVPIGESILGSLIVHPLSTRDEQQQYQHIGHEILLLGRGNYWVSGQNKVVRNTVGEIEAAIDALKANQPTDHGIDVYIGRLQALRSSPSGIGQPTNPAYQFRSTCAYHQTPS